MWKHHHPGSVKKLIFFSHIQTQTCKHNWKGKKYLTFAASLSLKYHATANDLDNFLMLNFCIFPLWYSFHLDSFNERVTRFIKIIHLNAMRPYSSSWFPKLSFTQKTELLLVFLFKKVNSSRQKFWSGSVR